MRARKKRPLQDHAANPLLCQVPGERAACGAAANDSNVVIRAVFVTHVFLRACKCICLAKAHFMGRFTDERRRLCNLVRPRPRRSAPGSWWRRASLLDARADFKSSSSRFVPVVAPRRLSTRKTSRPSHRHTSLFPVLDWRAFEKAQRDTAESVRQRLHWMAKGLVQVAL